MSKDVEEYFLTLEDTGKFKKESTEQSVLLRHECGCVVAFHIGGGHCIVMCNKHYCECMEYNRESMLMHVTDGSIHKLPIKEKR